MCHSNHSKTDMKWPQLDLEHLKKTIQIYPFSPRTRLPEVDTHTVLRLRPAAHLAASAASRTRGGPGPGEVNLTGAAGGPEDVSG